MGNTESQPNPKINIVEAIGQNKNTINLLNKKIIHSEKRVNDEIQHAKQCLQLKKKSKALIHLKRKKMLQKQIDNITEQHWYVTEQLKQLAQQLEAVSTQIESLRSSFLLTPLLSVTRGGKYGVVTLPPVGRARIVKMREYA